MVNNVLNETPSLQDKQRRTPQQMFSNANIHTNPKHWKPFGCPAHVLDSDLQQQLPFHKWKEQAKVGVHLGKLPQHAKNVDMTLNRHTGLVSPQFHAVCDKQFHAMKEDIFDSLWQVKAGFVTAQELVLAKQKSKSNNQMTSSEGAKPQKARAANNAANKGQKRPRSASTTNDTMNVNEQCSREQSNAHCRQQADGRANRRGHPNSCDQNDQHNQPRHSASLGTPQTTRRSGQRAKPINPLMVAMKAETSNSAINDMEGKTFCFQATCPNPTDPHHDQLEDNPLLACNTTADPDTMHMHQAMKQPDKEQFIKVMDKDEWKDQIKNGNFSLLHRSKAPKGATVLPAAWQIQRNTLRSNLLT